jgi:hypothetical protein
MFEKQAPSRDLNRARDPYPSVSDELARGRAADDETRLAVLEELYRSLESSLEGDLHQEGSARL